MKARCAASLSARVPKADACKDRQSSRAFFTHGPLLRESDLLVFDVVEICLFSIGVSVFFFTRTLDSFAGLFCTGRRGLGAGFVIAI